MYRLLPNEDQTQITDSVRQFLAAELPVERFRPNVQNLRDETALWPQMAELGWFGLGVAEDKGGVGYGFAEEILLLRECGRHLASPSVTASLLAVHVALAANEQNLARTLISGEQRAAMAIPAGDELLLFDHRGEELVLLALGESEFRIYPGSQFAQAAQRPCLDESLLLKAVYPPDAAPLASAHDKGLAQRYQLMCAVQLLGGAEAARDLAVEYAKVREQFGRPIGSFQAVKHKCTDMAVRTELAWAQIMEAALDVQHAQPNAALKVAAAKWLAADAAYRNSDACVQVHGGIGFQAECNAHLFVKRAHVFDQLAGGQRPMEKQLLEQVSPL